MANIRKRNNKWQVRIQRKDGPHQSHLTINDTCKDTWNAFTMNS